MRVVVTGGAGFIGANLCRHLGVAGVDTVVALDDLSTGSRTNLDGSPAELVEGSILDPDLLDDVIQGAGAVVHLAARPSAELFPVGTRVESDRWGEGTVQRYDGDQVTVLFDDHGYRDLLVPLVVERRLLRERT